MKNIAVFTLTLLIGLASTFTDLRDFATHAQTVRYPNELKGYEFFGKGKLKPIVLGTSSKQDVQKLFADTCEKGCDYDGRFLIKFDYLSCDSCMTTEYIRNRAMCPLSEYMGTVQKITLTPKLPIFFNDISTSPFPKNNGGSILLKDGSGGVSYESFSDAFGLKYSIKRGETSSLTLASPGPSYMSGPLYSIEYGLSVEVETKIFKAEYKTCKGKSSQ
jgi:hypothetical protein